MSREPNFACGIDKVLLIISLASDCSAAGDVTGPSYETQSPPTTRQVQYVSDLFGWIVQRCFPYVGVMPGGLAV